MDLNGYNTAIDRFEKDLERLDKAHYTTREPPYFLDDSHLLSVSAEHVHQTQGELEENVDILRHHLVHLETVLADRKREKETIHGVLAQLKAERTKLDPTANGKREAPAVEAETDPKKAKVVPPPVAVPKK